MIPHVISSRVSYSSTPAYMASIQRLRKQNRLKGPILFKTESGDAVTLNYLIRNRTLSPKACNKLPSIQCNEPYLISVGDMLRVMDMIGPEALCSTAVKFLEGISGLEISPTKTLPKSRRHLRENT